MKNLDKANEWLKRAKSNMARAKSGRVSPDILYEDLCYITKRKNNHDIFNGIKNGTETAGGKT